MRGLRLDWFRFQAYVSRSRSSFSLTDEHNHKFAVTMNTTVFHLKMVDLLEEMLRETSDLSLYWYKFSSLIICVFLNFEIFKFKFLTLEVTNGKV